MTFTVDQRRIIASVAACANIPLEALENEKCLIERMMDAIASGGGWGYGKAKPEKAQPVKQEEKPVLTEEFIAQVEQLERDCKAHEADSKKYFDLWQQATETVNRLNAEKKALETQVERLERKIK